MPPRVTVFILNYQGLRFLGSELYRSIESALHIDCPNLDVVLIDNGSTDGSLEAVKNRFGNDVESIRLDRNYGYAGGNERGFRRYRASGGCPDYAVFMNNDFIVTNDGFVRDAMKFMEDKRDIGLCQGYHLRCDGVHVDNAGAFVDVFMNAIHRCDGLSISECPRESSYVSYVNGSCFVANVRITLEVRGSIFHPGLFAYWDETELALGLWSHGVKSMFIPEVIGIHLGSKSFGRTSPLHTYLVERNRHIVRRQCLAKPLNMLSMPSELRSLSRLPVRPFQGMKGKLITKALVDSYLSRPLEDAASGPFSPLIVVPKRFSSFAAYLLGDSRRLLRATIGRLGKLVVTGGHLKSSSRPFLLMAEL